MGSRDRKQVSEMCYCFFRLGHSLKNISKEERILAGLFLTNRKKEQILEYLRPEWHALIEKELEEKLEIIRGTFPDLTNWKYFLERALSAGINHPGFCVVFLKSRDCLSVSGPGQEAPLTEKMIRNKIDFQDADPESVLPFKTYSLRVAPNWTGYFY